jgi:hypothetical protein
MNIEEQLAEDGFEDRTFLLESCLYVLCLDDSVQYVGRTTDIVVRLIKHRRLGRVAFNRVYVKSIPRDLASAEEVKLIREFCPALNVASAVRVRRSTRAEVKAAGRRILIDVGLRREPLVRRA